ncbi:MAG: type II toxin-antitoxin system VapC family toxin [Deltaproteobacteria bacterium]|nr:MAG: type II toxin-antitoxin system VapC family toxin [Deltaproteobacteria bacterium]
MRKILFDTDVVIEFLRHNPVVTEQMKVVSDSGWIMAISPITESEVWHGVRSNEKKKTEDTLSMLECLSADRQVGRRAGDYLRKYSKSHGLELPDAIIAATAVIHKFELCTFNLNHYPMHDVKHYRMER